MRIFDLFSILMQLLGARMIPKVIWLKQVLHLVVKLIVKMLVVVVKQSQGPIVFILRKGKTANQASILLKPVVELVCRTACISTKVTRFMRRMKCHDTTPVMVAFGYYQVLLNGLTRIS